MSLLWYIFPPRRTWKGLAWTTLFQFLAACIPSFLQSQYGTYAVPFWPASGVAVAAVLLGGPWMLVGVYLALMLNGLGFNSFESVMAHATLCVPNLIEAALAWLLLVRVAPDFQKNLSRLRDLGWFLLLAPWIPALVSSGLTQIILSFLSEAPRDFTKEVSIYFLGNVTGILLVAPFLLVWRDVHSFNWKSPLGGMVLGLLVVMVLGLLLHNAHFLPEIGPLFSSLLVPLALYGVWLTGLRGSSLLVLCSSLIYFAYDLSGAGSFFEFVLSKLQAMDPQNPAAVTPFEDTYYAKRFWITGISNQLGFLGLMIGTVLPLGAVLDELRRKTRTQSMAMQALETSFWSWNREGGFTLENPSLAKSLPRLDSLFDPDKTSGSKRIKVHPEGPDEFRSHWNVVSADRLGQPQIVVGLLQELTLHRQLDSALAKADHLDLEIRTLRSHLNPHLLFNCLTGLRGLISEDPDQAREFAGDLARFLREVVDLQSKPLIPVSAELKICEDFLRLEKLRGRPVSLESRIDSRAAQTLVPPLTLVTLLENASKHGLKSSSGPLRIELHTSWDRRGDLQINVRQPGLLKKETARSASSGLSLIRRQFEKLMPAGTTVFLRQEEKNYVTTCVSIPAPATNPS